MTVYVDDMGARRGIMRFFHMLADTDEELHAMADRIGVKRRWHQAPPVHDSHYDITSGKRDLAGRYGAVFITLKQAGLMNMRRKITGSLGPPDEAEWWFLTRD